MNPPLPYAVQIYENVRAEALLVGEQIAAVALGELEEKLPTVSDKLREHRWPSEPDAFRFDTVAQAARAWTLLAFCVADRWQAGHLYVVGVELERGSAPGANRRWGRW